MSRFPSTALFALALALPFPAMALERADLLPPEAQAYVRISNTTNFWSQFKKSSVGRLWADRQFQDFIGHPDAETWKEMVFKDKSGTEGELIMEQLKMLGGEFILALDPGSEEPCIVAAMAEADFRRSLDMDEKLKAMSKEPFEILKHGFQGVEIVQHIENAGSPDASSTWQADVGGTFMLGPSREWVEQCIVRLGKETVKEPAGNPVLNLNLPLATLLRQAFEASPEKGSNLPYEQQALLEALGLLGIEHLSARMELQDDQLVIDTTLQADGFGKGLLTLVDTRPSDLPSAAFIPQAPASFETGRLNLLALWREIPRMVEAVMPAAKPQLDLLLAMIRQQTGIDLEQDLLAHLDTQYFAFSTIEAERDVSVFALGLRDGRAFRQGFDTAQSAPTLQPQIAAMLDVQEFLGHTLYLTRSENPDEVAAFAVLDDYLVYGDPDGIRQALRTTYGEATAPYVPGELVQGLRRFAPSGAFAFSAVDWKKNMVVLIRELATPEHTRDLTRKWAQSGSPLPPPDFGKMPPAEHIASFFNVSYQYTEAVPEGLHQKIVLKY